MLAACGQTHYSLIINNPSLCSAQFTTVVLLLAQVVEVDKNISDAVSILCLCKVSCLSYSYT